MADKNTKQPYRRTEDEIVDEDLNVLIYKTQQSKNWYFQYNHPDMGQRNRSLRTRNKKESKRRAFELITKMRNGKLGKEEKQEPSVLEVIEQFIQNKKRRGLAKSTLGEYTRGLKQFHTYCERKKIKKLSKLTPSLMVEYEKLLRGEGITNLGRRTTYGRPAKPNKSTSAHEKLKLAKSLMKFAKNWKFIDDNPITGYQLPPEGTPNVHSYTDKEVQGICKHAEPFFDKLFAFLATTGLRQSELRHLTKSDFDKEYNRIKVQEKTLDLHDLAWEPSQEDKGKTIHWKPKNGDRVVPLCQAAFEITVEMLETQDGILLFPAPREACVKDRLLRSGRLWAQLQKAKEKAGVENGSLHSFRHYFVSAMANANVPMPQLMKIAGHNSMEVTQGYYHAEDDDLQQAVDKVNFGKFV